MEQPHTDLFSLLPVVSRAVAEQNLADLRAFVALTPAQQAERLEQSWEALDAHDPNLADAIQGLLRGILSQEYVSSALSEEALVHLSANLTYAFIVVLRALNEARREELG